MLDFQVPVSVWGIIFVIVFFSLKLDTSVTWSLMWDVNMIYILRGKLIRRAKTLIQLVSDGIRLHDTGSTFWMTRLKSLFLDLAVGRNLLYCINRCESKICYKNNLISTVWCLFFPSHFITIYVCMYIYSMYVCTYIYMYIHMYVCTYIYMYIYMYVCTYIYVCMYIYVCAFLPTRTHKQDVTQGKF